MLIPQRPLIRRVDFSDLRARSLRPEKPGPYEPRRTGYQYRHPVIVFALSPVL